MLGHSIRVMRVLGFDIKVDVSWALIAGLIVWSLSTGYFPAILPAASPLILLIDAVVAMLGLFASIVFHELAHSLVARRYGVRICGITLFLFGGVAELAEEPRDPDAEIAIAIAGPAASLGLAAGFWAVSSAVDMLALPPSWGAVASYLAGINLILGLFNLVPALPLDGGRVYRAILWRRSGDLVSATRRAARVSAAFSLAMILVGTVALFGANPAHGVWPILLGLFLFTLGRATAERVEMNAALHGRAVGNLMTRVPISVGPDQTLEDVVSNVFLAEGISFAPIIEQTVLLGYIDLDLIRRIDRENWATTTVDDVMEGLAPEQTVTSNLPLNDLSEQIAKSGRRKFLVVDDDRLVGVITLSDLMAFVALFRRLAAPA